MVHLSVIEAKITKLGIRLSRWCRPELRELQRILMDDEEIMTLANGRYFGGFALLVATDQRLLLVDKKALFLSVEDIRYDMISEIDFSIRLLDATISVFSVNKQHRFTTFKHKKHLRDLTSYAQRRVMELRHYQQQQPVTTGPQLLESPARAYKPVSYAQTFVSDEPMPLEPISPSFIPSRYHLPGRVGNAALRGARWVSTNPYTRTPLVMRKQWSQLDS